MAPLKVLIAGAGIGGPVAAYWLSKAGHHVTIVEKSKDLRATGQSIDIRKSAVEIIRKMGLEDAISAKCTDEAGIAWVDAQDRVQGAFAASGDKERQSFTSEFEILRGDLAIVFYEATKDLPNVKFVFNETIHSISQPQSSSSATVSFTSSPSSSQEYDVVIGADGLGSHTRHLTFETSTREHLYSYDIFAAYYTADIDLLGADNYARWFNAPGRKYILLRPDPERKTRATLMVLHGKDDAKRQRYIKAFRSGADEIREMMKETFAGVDWFAPELIKAMYDTDDLYGSEVAQIRMESIVKGRVALLGDAGYCPTPLTGMGTSMAIIGAYVLAGELSKGSAQDVPEALRRYQDIIHPYAKKVQNVPKWVPKIANPDTAWGIAVVHSILAWVTWLKIDRIAMTVAAWLPQGKSEFELPKYDWAETKKTA